MNDVQSAFSNVVVLNGERARFAIAGGNYRLMLIVAFKFRSKIAFVKFTGTHKKYDGVNALTVSQYYEASYGYLNPSQPSDNRYETALWRQVVQTLFLLDGCKRRLP